MSRLKTVVVALVATVFLAAAATPAGARMPSGTASASFVQVGPCSLEVTYTWSDGFRGKGVDAYFGVYYKIGPTGKVWVFDRFPADPAGGLVTETFQVSGLGSHDWYAGGSLVDYRQRTLDGSTASSPDSVHLDCP